MFDRVRNLARIAKLYNLLRDLKEKKLYSSTGHWYRVIKTAIEITEVKEMLTMLQGYKSYIVAILSAAVMVAYSMGYIDEATRDQLLKLLAAGGLATVAAKLNRLNQTVQGKR